MIEDLEKKNKQKQKEIESFTKRLDDKRSSVIKSGNEGVLEFLKSAQKQNVQRIQALNEEKKKLKSGHLIETSEKEELFIKKAHIRSTIDDLKQQLLQAQYTGEFFNKQKNASTIKSEKEKLNKIVNNWTQKEKALQTKITNMENDLKKLESKN